MSCIRILTEAVANRIAAGEVIERPASVVKELIENSIDSGANRILIHCENGGRSLIQVSDNGCGMDQEDAMLCIAAHATSKVRNAEDIERINTLGFRGEALPSISAVSRFTLQTRQTEAIAGTEVIVESGTLRDVRDCGCPPGTMVRVRDLFCGLPARRKFLRTRNTEEEHIREAVLLQALAHKGVAFELFFNNLPVLRVNDTVDPGARVAMLLGRDVAAAMLPMNYEEDGISVSGFLARPGLTRGSRRDQRIFVNFRPAAAENVYAGIREAYHTLVMKGRYPPLVLYLELDPDRVDVNVHPAKHEVRFREPQLVGQVVAAALRQALRGLVTATAPRIGPGLQSAPALSPPASSFVEQQLPLADTDTSAAAGVPFPAPPCPESRNSAPAAAGFQPVEPFPAAVNTTVPESDQENTEADSAIAVVSGTGGSSPSAATRAEIDSLRVLGIVDNLYILAQGSSGLVLIDQHAAHERIMFEKLLAAAVSEGAHSQALLIPVTVDMSAADSRLLNQSLQIFNRLGFGIEHFGGNTFLVTAVPPQCPQQNVAGFLRDILDELRQGTGGSVPRPDEIRLAQAACKQAVKAADLLKPDEIRRLLADLAETEMPYTCPHGRPVMINIPYKEIEKRFGRRV